MLDSIALKNQPYQNRRMQVRVVESALLNTFVYQVLVSQYFAQTALFNTNHNNQPVIRVPLVSHAKLEFKKNVNHITCAIKL